MAPPTDAAAEAFARVLAEERLRSTRQINLFRLMGVTAFLALMTAFRLVVAGWVPPPLSLFTAYWAAAAAVWWASMRSDRLARLAGLSIPLVDMPLVFLILRGAIAALWAGGRHTDALAYQAPLYYISFIFLASLALPVLVSEETRGRVGGAIVFSAAGPVRVKGKSQPIQSYVPALAAGGQRRPAAG